SAKSAWWLQLRARTWSGGDHDRAREFHQQFLSRAISICAIAWSQLYDWPVAEVFLKSMILLASCSNDFSRSCNVATPRVVTTIRQQNHRCPCTPDIRRPTMKRTVILAAFICLCSERKMNEEQIKSMVAYIRTFADQE